MQALKPQHSGALLQVPIAATVDPKSALEDQPMSVSAGGGFAHALPVAPPTTMRKAPHRSGSAQPIEIPAHQGLCGPRPYRGGATQTCQVAVWGDRQRIGKTGP